MVNIIDYNTTAEQFNDALKRLHNTIDGLHITEYEQGKKYATLEYKNMYFYIEITKYTRLEPCTITEYKKIDALHKQQASYPLDFNTFEGLKNIILQAKEKRQALKGTEIQRIFSANLYTYTQTKSGEITKLQYLKNKYKNIFDNLERVETIKHDEKQNILRFTNTNGDSIEIDGVTLEEMGRL